MSSDVWVGAISALGGAAVGAVLTFLSDRSARAHQLKLLSIEASTTDRRRFEDRRFDAYSDFVVRARAFRLLLQSASVQSDAVELDALLRNTDEAWRQANEAAALVYLVTPSEATHDACSAVLDVLERVHSAISSDPKAVARVWAEVRTELRETRQAFQRVVRVELGMASGGIAHSRGEP